MNKTIEYVYQIVIKPKILSQSLNNYFLKTQILLSINSSEMFFPKHFGNMNKFLDIFYQKFFFSNFFIFQWKN